MVMNIVEESEVQDAEALCKSCSFWIEFQRLSQSDLENPRLQIRFHGSLFQIKYDNLVTKVALSIPEPPFAFQFPSRLCVTSSELRWSMLDESPRYSNISLGSWWSKKSSIGRWGVSWLVTTISQPHFSMSSRASSCPAQSGGVLFLLQLFNSHAHHTHMLVVLALARRRGPFGIARRYCRVEVCAALVYMIGHSNMWHSSVGCDCSSRWDGFLLALEDFDWKSCVLKGTIKTP